MKYHFCILILIICFFIKTTCCSAAQEVFKSHSANQKPNPPRIHSDLVIRQQVVELHPDLQSQGFVRQMNIALFEDSHLAIVCDQIRPAPQKAELCSGYIVNKPQAKVLLILTQEGLAGIIDFKTRQFKIRPLEQSFHLVREVVLATERSLAGIAPDSLTIAASVQTSEVEVFEAVNLERAQEGLAPLSWHKDLFNAARAHSQDMATENYFAHDSLDGHTPCERISQAGYTWRACGENIAAGYGTPQEAITAWMASSGHRANILSDNYCDLGVGYVYVEASSYGHYWTQSFGRLQGVSTCPESITPPDTEDGLDGSETASSSSSRSQNGCFLDLVLDSWTLFP